MKRFLAFLLILLLTTLSAGCNGGGGGDSGGGGAAPTTSNVTLKFDVNNMLAANEATQDIMLAKIIDFITMAKTCYAAQLYEFITSLHVKVTDSEMLELATLDEVITNPSSTFSVTLTVPNGPDRRFYIELKDSRNDKVLYSGDLTIDIGDYQGTPQDISIDVTLDEGISVEDYIEIGRGHLESYKLELAFIAFDTAVCLDNDHPVANFFRGFTHLLLLVQKDDSEVDTVAPNADIASMLSLYNNLDDIYLSSIAPDIYNEDYDEDLENFYDDWQEPSDITTDSGVGVLEDVTLPELDKIISDLANAEADPVFSTTLTSGMHFSISPDDEIKVDRADVYILEAIAYGLKAYLNHILAYNLRTDVDYWRDEFEKMDDEDEDYEGLESIIDNDPGDPLEEVFDFASDVSSRLSDARSAYSTGLDKLKAALQSINRRSVADKEAEDHIFNVADVADDVDESLNKVNIDKIITTIDGIKDALDKEVMIRCYDSYDDTTAEADKARVNLSTLFSSPDRNSRPEFYYHSASDTDMPVFDTNRLESSSAFIEAFTDVLVRLKESDDKKWTDINSLEDALSKELLPSPYKFDVYEVDQGDITIDGQLSDYNSKGIKPVMFDEEDDEKNKKLDLTKVYMAQDSKYLYMALKLRGKPLAGPFATEPTKNYLNYNIRFNARDSDCSYNSAPISIELHGSEASWEWHLYSYGNHIGSIPALDFAIGDILEFRIPLSGLADAIENYQWVEPGETWEWNEKDIFVAVSLWSNISSKEAGDWLDECLASGLNIGD